MAGRSGPPRCGPPRGRRCRRCPGSAGRRRGGRPARGTSSRSRRSRWCRCRRGARASRGRAAWRAGRRRRRGPRVAAHRARDEGHAAAVGRPAGQAEQVRVEGGDDLLDPLPGEGGHVDDLDLVPRAQGLGAEGEEAVRRLVEVRVEIPLRTRWGGRRRRFGGPRLGIFHGGGYSKAMRMGSPRHAASRRVPHRGPRAPAESDREPM